MQGQGGAVPAEALWARQGLDQLSGANPPQVPTSPVMQGDPRVQGFGTPMPQIQSRDPGLDFPTAMPKDPPKQSFPGAKSVEGQALRPAGNPEKENQKEG